VQIQAAQSVDKGGGLNWRGVWGKIKGHGNVGWCTQRRLCIKQTATEQAKWCDNLMPRTWN